MNKSGLYLNYRESYDNFIDFMAATTVFYLLFYFPICHILNNNVQHKSPIIIKGDMNNNNVIKFRNLVKTIDWDFVCFEISCQASFSLFHKNYLSILTLASPSNILSRIIKIENVG